ncbi:peptidase S8/S53 domain-containing protein [Cantharellus anzutake]|uniref:peptidase S8/S53 domain-containing protein n=1 Tax=Cantharellus anzutake TaxID=1750568 RepID=UPI0019078A12|nr:peptidase S8/S53 domain-containing protein [Cantharellus anzutake]KAF8328681.1 peptidase S8/S53 domain-containing protein [Cantharellus anzutake]
MWWGGSDVFAWLSSSLLLLIPVVHCLTENPFIIKESAQLPRGWSISSRPSPHERLTLHIGLVQTCPEAIESLLYNISDPSSSSYSQFLSREAVLPYFRPPNTTLLAVNNWLRSNLIWPPTKISPAKDWYTISATVAQAEELLNAEFKAYIQPYSGERIVRATAYGVPRTLDKHIDTIQPITIFPGAGRSTRSFSNVRRLSFPGPSDRRRVRALNAPDEVHLAKSPHVMLPSQFPNCTSSPIAVFPPWCLKKMYNATGYTPLGNLSNFVGITGYLDNFAQRSDMEDFFKAYVPQIAATKYTFSIVSPTNTEVPQKYIYGDSNSEANLDVQIVGGLIYPIPSTFYSVGGSPPYNPDVNTPFNANEPFLELVHYFMSLPNEQLPSVLTTSYGDDEQSVPRAYAVRVCRGFAALGARGVSVIFSSGDMGVGPYADRHSNDCLSNDGKDRTMFIPSFPATCPFVTTVGETYGIPQQMADSGSSGGFSNYFKRPMYQISEYVKKLGKTYAGMYNPSGRGFPDLSSYGERIPYYNAHQLSLCFGTSCAAPTVAALVALLHDHQLRRGRRRLGFLNPLLYSGPARNGLTDIIAGNNPGCGTDGFSAEKGWDPITGLGTINFGKMLEVLDKIAAQTHGAPYEDFAN